MHAPVADLSGRPLLLRRGAAVALGLALASLAWRATEVLAAATALISFPLSLDYGEGIVLQQALMMTGPRAYGPITELPFVVFHYPPVYHLVVRAVAAVAGGGDVALVTAGRAVSLFASIATAIAVGALAHGLTAEELGRSRRIVAGTAAGLLLLGTWPFAYWLPFARVDMLALAFTMTGLALAVRAGESRTRLHGAVLLFVLAMFTKQISIAAPAAIVIALLMSDRRRGLEVIVSGLAVSLVLLGLAQWHTQGGFLHHVVGYNVNRFVPERLLGFAVRLPLDLPTLAAILIGLYARDSTRPRDRDRTPRVSAVTVAFLHLAICTAMLVMLGKSGSNANYLLEWYCALAVLAGMAVGQAMLLLQTPHRSLIAGPVGAMLIGATLTIQAFVLPNPRLTHSSHSALSAETTETLIRLVQGGDRPPISDDMVLVLRGGKPVQWEPAIFAELASLGRWDEGLIIEGIRSGRFSMAVTQGSRGDALFDSRYNTAVADAMDAIWPQKAQLGHYVLHLPAGAALPSNAVPHASGPEP